MTPAAKTELADRLDRASTPDLLRFGIWPTGGWVHTGLRDTAMLLADLWNHRKVIAAALRSSADPQ